MPSSFDQPSLLFILAEDDSIGVVYTRPTHRRQGLSRQLLRLALRDHSNLKHSDSLTGDGEAFSRGTPIAELAREPEPNTAILGEGRPDFIRFVTEPTEGAYPATDENLALAKKIALLGWRTRARERGKTPPRDLSYSCKFSSLLIKRLFGGEITGNSDHQFNRIGGKIIDINWNCEDVESLKRSGSNPHRIDSDFLFNPDHLDSLHSCLPRVEGWANEFRRMKREISYDLDPSP